MLAALMLVTALDAAPAFSRVSTVPSFGRVVKTGTGPVPLILFPSQFYVWTCG